MSDLVLSATRTVADAGEAHLVRGILGNHFPGEKQNFVSSFLTLMLVSIVKPLRPFPELLPGPLELVVVMPEGAFEVLRGEENVELDVGRSDQRQLGPDVAKQHRREGRQLIGMKMLDALYQVNAFDFILENLRSICQWSLQFDGCNGIGAAESIVRPCHTATKEMQVQRVVGLPVVWWKPRFTTIHIALTKCTSPGMQELPG